MTEPLALLLCERGLIATQLAERLEALRYRMVVVSKPVDLVTSAEKEKAMVVLLDLETTPDAAVRSMEQLRRNQSTSHIPVVAFGREMDDAKQSALVQRGATIAVTEAAILSHLSHLLNRALEV